MSKARMRLASRWLPYLSSSFCGWELGQTISNTISKNISNYLHIPQSPLPSIESIAIYCCFRCETLRALAETPPCAEAHKTKIHRSTASGLRSYEPVASCFCCRVYNMVPYVSMRFYELVSYFHASDSCFFPRRQCLLPDLAWLMKARLARLEGVIERLWFPHVQIVQLPQA